jgi:hypothetical protein
VRNLIIADYQEFIALHGHEFPDDMIRALKANERVPLFLNNLVKEITIAEHRRKVNLKRSDIKMIVYDMTRSFLKLIKRRADEMQMSDLEKSRLVAEEAKRHSVNAEEAAELTKELTYDKVIVGDDTRDVV